MIKIYSQDTGIFSEFIQLQLKKTKNTGSSLDTYKIIGLNTFGQEYVLFENGSYFNEEAAKKMFDELVGHIPNTNLSHVTISAEGKVTAVPVKREAIE